MKCVIDLSELEELYIKFLDKVFDQYQIVNYLNLTSLHLNIFNNSCPKLNVDSIDILLIQNCDNLKNADENKIAYYLAILKITQWYQLKLWSTIEIMIIKKMEQTGGYMKRYVELL